MKDHFGPRLLWTTSFVDRILYELHNCNACTSTGTRDLENLFVLADASDDAEPPDKISGILKSVARLLQINVTQDRISIVPV